MIRILLVDDHPVVRAGIQGMLAKHEQFNIVGEAENGEQAIQLAGERLPDVILMDLRMPVMDGLEAMIQIRQTHPDIQVLILTTYDSDTDIVAAINAGAVGYLLKDAPREELYLAIQAAAQGKTALNPGVASRLMERIRNPSPESRFSQRELDILERVSEGHTNKDIAKQLFISEATVKTHLLHIFAKLDVSDRAAAVRVAIERGILYIKRH